MARRIRRSIAPSPWANVRPILTECFSVPFGRDRPARQDGMRLLIGIEEIAVCHRPAGP
jgi:hypothetical protein